MCGNQGQEDTEEFSEPCYHGKGGLGIKAGGVTRMRKWSMGKSFKQESRQMLWEIGSS